MLLYDPVNIRYATDSTNMQVWTLHNLERYAVVFADRHVILWDFHGCGHLNHENPQINEIRSAVSWSYFSAGSRQAERAKIWATELDDIIRQRVAGDARIAIDLNFSMAAGLLAEHGHRVVEGDALMQQARLIKSADEISLMRHAVAVADTGMQWMHDELKPGITENQLWAHLHFENIRHGGAWIETRLLSSGPRTNPWMQECSDRIMQAGEMLSFDTDLIGPFGYCADISRSWTVGHTPPTAQQRKLYSAAYDQLQHNQALLHAGLSFREFSEAAWKIAPEYYANRYCCIAHGVGMADEFPAIAHQGADWGRSGYDGQFQKNMVVCIESYIGEQGGTEGVKLEQQVVINDSGCEVLSNIPFEQSWLA